MKVYTAFTGAWYDGGKEITEDEVDSIEAVAEAASREAISPAYVDEDGVWHVPDPSNTGDMHFATDRDRLRRYIDNRPQLIVTFG